MDKPLSYDEISENGNLCEHCRCTNYGLEDYHGEMKCGPNGPYGCEGEWCSKAYERYLEDFEEEQ